MTLNIPVPKVNRPFGFHISARAVRRPPGAAARGPAPGPSSGVGSYYVKPPYPVDLTFAQGQLSKASGRGMSGFFTGTYAPLPARGFANGLGAWRARKFRAGMGDAILNADELVPFDFSAGSGAPAMIPYTQLESGNPSLALEPPTIDPSIAAAYGFTGAGTQIVAPISTNPALDAYNQALTNAGYAEKATPTQLANIGVAAAASTPAQLTKATQQLNAAAASSSPSWFSGSTTLFGIAIPNIGLAAGGGLLAVLALSGGGKKRRR